VVPILVQLTRLWITSVVSQQTFGWYTGTERTQSYTVQGDIRPYAGGRQRAVGSAGVAGSWTFELMELTLADTVVLRTWLGSGVTVFARDHRGQSMYGTFFELEITENPATTYDSPQNTYRASITLRSVDVVEGV
jgi:hypothetical protein